MVQHLKTKLGVEEDQPEKAMIELRFVKKEKVVLNAEISLCKKNDELTASIHFKRDGSKMKKLILLMIIAWLFLGSSSSVIIVMNVVFQFSINVM